MRCRSRNDWWGDEKTSPAWRERFFIGGLLLPGAPRTALIAYAATASASLSLALVEWPDNGGTMPSKRRAFTTRVEPLSPPQCPSGKWWRRRALPPGPLRLFHAPFIAIASELA